MITQALCTPLNSSIIPFPHELSDPWPQLHPLQGPRPQDDLGTWGVKPQK